MNVPSLICSDGEDELPVGVLVRSPFVAGDGVVPSSISFVEPNQPFGIGAEEEGPPGKQLNRGDDGEEPSDRGKAALAAYLFISHTPVLVNERARPVAC